MKLFSKCVDYFFTGLGFGAVFYLLILTFAYPGIAPTPKGVVSVFVLSGLIGLLGLIFIPDLPFILALALHFVGTFLLFLVMVTVNKWSIDLWTLSLFLVIYVVIWLICILELKKSAKRINARIKKRNAQGK
ncbi:DUF3021 domain-containing protein [Lactobacillus sp. XV13L]|nr:DUF3021 domain-containing protein [Lactobacillus sp. XV13L]